MSHHITLSSRPHVPPSRARRARTLSVESVESLESRTLLNGGALLATLRSGHALIAEVAYMHGRVKAPTPTPPPPTPTPPPPTTTPTPPPSTPTSNLVVSWLASLKPDQSRLLVASLTLKAQFVVVVVACLRPNVLPDVQTQVLHVLQTRLLQLENPSTPPSPTTPMPGFNSPVSSWLAYFNLNQPNSPIATWLAGEPQGAFIRLMVGLTAQQKQALANEESLPPNDQKPFLDALKAQSSQLESLVSTPTPGNELAALGQGFDQLAVSAAEIPTLSDEQVVAALLHPQTSFQIPPSDFLPSIGSLSPLFTLGLTGQPM